jgi:hypothetical protein
VETPLFAYNREPRCGGRYWNQNPEIEVPNYFAKMRTNTAQEVSVLGKGYEVVKNRNAFSFFDAIVGGHGFKV